MFVLYCCIIALVYGVFLLIDSVMIKERADLDVDDYLIAALIIYTDIVLIFVYLIMAFGGGGGRN